MKFIMATLFVLVLAASPLAAGEVESDHPHLKQGCGYLETFTII